MHIDVSSAADYHKEDLVPFLIERLIMEFKEVFQEKINYNQSIQFVITNVFRLTGKPFVIIIDEWDCVIRNYADCRDLVHKYLQFLHSLFKGEEAKSFLALGYITGILPIKKVKDESALNNFDEYTMISSTLLTEYFGFTEKEVKILLHLVRLIRLLP